MYYHTFLIDNGFGSRQILLFSFRGCPRKSIQPSIPYCDPTIRSSLQLPDESLLLFLNGFSYFFLAFYTSFSGLSIPFLKTAMKMRQWLFFTPVPAPAREGARGPAPRLPHLPSGGILPDIRLSDTVFPIIHLFYAKSNSRPQTQTAEDIHDSICIQGRF